MSGTVNSPESFYEPIHSERGSAIAVGKLDDGDEIDDSGILIETSPPPAEPAHDPHDHGNPGKPTTNMQTLMNLIKGNVGIGILAMPSALVNAGIIMGTGGVLMLGFLAEYCMKQIVDVSVYLAKRNPATGGVLNYPDTCEQAFCVSFPQLRPHSRKFRMFVNVFIVATQVMACTSYLLFLATTIDKLVVEFTGFKLKIQIWELMVLVVLLPFIQFRHLKSLSIFTTIANVCVLISLLIIFQFVIRDRTIAVENFNIWGDISKYPLAFGTIIFSFEGINLVMPLRNKMKVPEEFDGWNGVLITGMSLIAILYCFMGFFGYLRIGDAFQGVLTDYIIPLIGNDPLGWLYALCIALVITQIYISYGLQIYVAVIILFPPIAKYYELSPRAAFWAQTGLRCLLALLTYGFAASVPCLDEIFSLVGALTGSSLSIIFPSIVHVVTFAPEYSSKGKRLKLAILLLKNCVILVIGFIGFIVGTYTAVDQIVYKLSNNMCHE